MHRIIASTDRSAASDRRQEGSHPRRRVAASPGRFAALLVTTLLLGALATTAWAVDVRGSLRIPSEYGAPQPESAQARELNRYWDEWNGFLDPRPRRFDPSRELAVVLTGPGELAAEQPGFAIANGGLRPCTIVERAGANLSIANNDPVTHQLFAEGLADFGPTPTAPGLARQQRVAEAGAWPLRDQRYSHVTGHLHVLPDLIARAAVQRDGTFLFRGVAPGAYTLKIFHRERELHTAQVTVPEDRELVVDPIAIGAAPAQ